MKIGDYVRSLVDAVDEDENSWVQAGMLGRVIHILSSSRVDVYYKMSGCSVEQEANEITRLDLESHMYKVLREHEADNPVDD